MDEHLTEYYQLVEEIQLVKICLDGMQLDYKPLLVNLHLPTFSKLVESAWNWGDSVQFSFSRLHCEVDEVRLPMSRKKEVVSKET